MATFVIFDNSQYKRSHMKDPRGYGSWAFSVPSVPAMRDPVFAPTSTFADAKKWMAAKVRAAAPADFHGHVYVDVLP